MKIDVRVFPALVAVVLIAEAVNAAPAVGSCQPSFGDRDTSEEGGPDNRDVS